MPPPKRRRRSGTSLQRVQDDRPLLARLLDAPNLELVVGQLPAATLHSLIQHSGLEECAALVEHATTEQLQYVLDLDVWRGNRPGADERLDADRFVAWIEVLMDAGPEAFARQLEKFDGDLLVAGFAQHVRVFDLATQPRVADEALSLDVGGYVIVAKRAAAWSTIVDALLTLHADADGLFHRVMRGCRRLSDSDPEIDGLDDLLTVRKQAMFDLAVDRDERRETLGFVPPAQARAFLDESRRRPHKTLSTPPAHATRLPSLVTPDATELAYLQDLAYLANVLLAGSSLQGRSFTPDEASRCAAAVLALGLESWRAQSGDPAIEWRPITMFQIGWRILYDEVCLMSAQRLLDALTGMQLADTETESELAVLRRALHRHLRDGAPWRARDALDAIAILDLPSWAALVALFDECPVMHAAISLDAGAHAVDASTFEFISTKVQIAAIRVFLDRLPDIFGV
jgi:hypothetical protein